MQADGREITECVDKCEIRPMRLGAAQIIDALGRQYGSGDPIESIARQAIAYKREREKAQT